jgi:hypothetical protein
MRRLTEAHEAGHVANRDRGLLDQLLRGYAQAAGDQVLSERDLAELGVRTSDLTR